MIQSVRGAGLRENKPRRQHSREMKSERERDLMTPLESLERALRSLGKNEDFVPKPFFKHHSLEFAARCHSKDGTKDIVFPLKAVFLGRLRTTARGLRHGR